VRDRHAKLSGVLGAFAAVCMCVGVGCRSQGGSAAEAPSGASSRGRSAGVIEQVPTVEGPSLDVTKPLYRIAFGSCLDEDKPQPIWSAIEAYDPQVFLFMGDNVYADAEEVPIFIEAYGKLAASEGYRSLRSKTPVLAIWDDHDYGRNDAGSEYPLKRESKSIMLDFFGVPADSERRKHDGAYDAVVVGPPGQQVQIILLDTRWFRTQLFPLAPSRYRDYDGDDATMLGEAQWAWLAEQLRVPAQLRLIVSSVQVVANAHDRERWGVFPKERDRLLALIGETGAAGVIVLSGDRHRGEISRLPASAVGYPLFDVTSSSLNRPNPEHEENPLRTGDLIVTSNFGTMDIVWEGQAHATLKLHDEAGVVVAREVVPFDVLQSEP